MTLKNKILLLTGMIAVSFLVIAMIGLQILKSASEKDNFDRIEQLFKSAYTTVSELERLSQSGEMSEAEAKELAAILLRENKYHPSEYVYIVDDNLDFIAAPHDPQLHGTSFHDFKDANGKSVGQIVERVTSRSPGRMVTYDWTSQREGQVVDLKSVAQKSKVWGWYVGTGISFKETDARYWSTARWVISASIVLTILIAGIMLRFSHSLRLSLGAEMKDVVAIVSKVSQGDLSGRVDDNVYPRESIAGSLTYMKGALHGVVQEIQSVGEALAAQVRDSEKQSAELGQLTNALHTDTHSAAGSVTGIANGLKSTTDSINLSAGKLEAAETKGIEANQLTKESGEAIGELEQNINSAGESVQQLASEVENIEGVLTVIQGVAEQTNLLALNAAIEAARAGEQGRGFAVVADEVRQLAHRTQESTQEIQTMIANLQTAAKRALTAVNDSVETSGSVVERSASASAAITELLSSVSDVAAMSNAILEDSKQQLSETDVISSRLEAISAMTEQAAGVANQVTQKSETLSGYAESLQEETEKFKI